MTASAPVTTPLTYTLPAQSLPENERKQQMSLAFLQMIVTAAGCSLSDPKTDYDGVDITVRSSSDYPHSPCPFFDMQLKCTSQDVVKQDHVSWRLDEAKHAKLTKRRTTPVFLGVLVVPTFDEGWLEHASTDQTMLLTRSTMYWCFGRILPAFTSGQDKQTVQIPRTNILNAVQLLRIMNDIGNGEYNAK